MNIYQSDSSVHPQSLQTQVSVSCTTHFRLSGVIMAPMRHSRGQQSANVIPSSSQTHLHFPSISLFLFYFPLHVSQTHTMRPISRSLAPEITIIRDTQL